MSDCKHCPLDTYGPGPTNYGRDVVLDLDAPPAPSWSSTPPTEPGHWWKRRFVRLDHSDVPKPYIVHVHMRDGKLWDESGEMPTTGEEHYEWWPVPIEPPRREP